jgi:hypothetical protein
MPQTVESDVCYLPTERTEIVTTPRTPCDIRLSSRSSINEQITHPAKKVPNQNKDLLCV